MGLFSEALHPLHCDHDCKSPGSRYVSWNCCWNKYCHHMPFLLHWRHFSALFIPAYPQPDLIIGNVKINSSLWAHKRSKLAGITKNFAFKTIVIVFLSMLLILMIQRKKTLFGIHTKIWTPYAWRFLSLPRWVPHNYGRWIHLVFIFIIFVPKNLLEIAVSSKEQLSGWLFK